ncbi:MAG: hypothetical protein RLZZ450_3958 [Pseudomonadota bacterium]
MSGAGRRKKSQADRRDQLRKRGHERTASSTPRGSDEASAGEPSTDTLASTDALASSDADREPSAELGDLRDEPRDEPDDEPRDEPDDDESFAADESTEITIAAQPVVPRRSSSSAALRSPSRVQRVVRALSWPPLAARLRLIAICVAGLLLVHAVRGDVLAAGYEPLRTALARHGLIADASEVLAIQTQRKSGKRSKLILRARAEGELGDVWLAEAVVAKSGKVSDLGRLHNLTQTSSADETTPLLLGRWALFARRIQGRVVGFELVDLEGEVPLERGLLAKLQRGIGNLQATGSWHGVGRRSYLLAVPSAAYTMKREGRAYTLEVDGARAVIDPTQERMVEGAALFEVRSHKPAVSAPLPWLVDTVRALPFVGAERIAWLENRVFALRDQYKRAYRSVNEVDNTAEVAQELGIERKQLSQVQEKVERLAVPNPESGWPPPSLEPFAVGEAVAGEGKWRALVDDPHARTLPTGKPVFYQTFLSADPERSFARVYLTVWDPRIVQLHIVAGTEEPVSATGETGKGAIPRNAATLTRLVGAFNGGFQAMHGEFGMMADGRVYLPPKPWAATVAVFSDGRVGMGSWPGPKDRKTGYDEARAVEEIPAGMVAFRQNLTSLVEDDRFNPWGRWWWGAAPQQRSEQTLTQRSALCFTREGFMIYAWGDSASPEALGSALLRARCVRAMHLDMNAGHSGMELYNVLAPDEPRDEITKREPYRYEGTLAELPGYTLRARKAVTAMGMVLPRYIRPDPRDFFYLTLKPGLETAPSTSDDLVFSSGDLPHAGWPPAFSRSLGPTARVLRIDPARAQPVTGEPSGIEQVLAELHGDLGEPKLEDSALYAEQELVGRRYAVGVPSPDCEIVVRGALLASSPEAQAALGVDAHGLLVYGETDDKRAGALQQSLAGAGVTAAIALPHGVRLGLKFKEGLLAVDATTRLKESKPALRLVATSTPAVELLFPDNAPIPYVRWASLQDQRVRYFRTSEPTSRVPQTAIDPAAP